MAVQGPNRGKAEPDRTVFAKRRGKRWPIEVFSMVSQPRQGRQVTAQMYDLSAYGCRFTAEEPFEPGAQILVRMAGLEDWPGTVVWSGPAGVGVEFHVALNAAVLEHYIKANPRK